MLMIACCSFGTCDGLISWIAWLRMWYN